MTEFVMGKPCKHGHDGRRYAKGNRCVECTSVINTSPKGKARALRHSRKPETKEKASRRKRSPVYKAKAAEYERRHAARIAARKRLSKYGITPVEWNFKLAGQGFRCDLCGTDEPGGRWNEFHTDHCHETGAVRGILCHGCNTSLGKLGDTPEGIYRAYLYTIGKFNWTQTERMDWTPLTSETDGRPKHSLPTEQNESRHTNWSAGLL